jgi:hypothetical protein
MSNKKILLKELNGLPKDITVIGKREKLWLESNKCRSCNVLMTLEPFKSNSLTIQHNSPKCYAGYNDDTTIWCNACNQKDALWKNKHKILSIQDCIRYETGTSTKVNGIFVIDGYIYRISNSKITFKKPLYEWKLNELKSWLHGIFIQKIWANICHNKKIKIISFDEHIESLINGWFTFKHYHMGGGWYAYKQKPSLVKHWVYRSPEEIKEEEEEVFLFSCLINNYY